MTGKKDVDIVFVPLGGTGEIGMNLNLYGLGREDDRDWLMIDMGITFGDGSLPGVDVIMPDPAFIEERRDRLHGLVLTHAHEDHLGAVPYLWERLRCPVYASPFTASVLRRKLEDAKLAGQVPLHIVPLKGHFNVGPFDLEMVTLTHSIPEPNAVALHGPNGIILHTGDWKLDPHPVVGETADTDILKTYGDAGVAALVCDSTNVFVDGPPGSESELRDSLSELIGRFDGRVAVTCFASNVARLETIARAADAQGRSIVAAGRAIHRISEAARENGYLLDVPPFLDEDAFEKLPRDKTLILCTGSQGEPRAALSRIAHRAHPRVMLDEGDVVIFSSKVIPGNERSIARLQNALVKLGVRIIGEKDEFVHVSGHPGRQEMETMYKLVRPRVSVPVHGELRHLTEHAELAKLCGVEEIVVAENGSVIRLEPGAAGIIDEVSVGRLVLEGNRVVRMDGELVRGRSKAVFNGSAVVTVVVDGWGAIVAEPQIAAVGLVEGEADEVHVAAIDAVWKAVEGLSKPIKRDDAAVREAVRIAVRRVFRDRLGKKPAVDVHFVRV